MNNLKEKLAGLKPSKETVKNVAIGAGGLAVGVAGTIVGVIIKSKTGEDIGIKEMLESVAEAATDKE